MPTSTELYNREAEAEIIGAFLIDPDQLYQVEIRAEDFYFEALRELYKTILGLYIDGIKPNPVSIMDRSPGTDRSLLSSIVSQAFTAANVRYHAKIVIDLAERRRYKTALLGLQPKICDEDFLVEAERTLLGLQEGSRKKQLTILEALREINADMLEAADRQHVGIQTGFTTLNRFCVGLCKKHLWILGAYTSLGKSTWLSQLVADICEAGARTLIFSVEDSIHDKLYRLQATLSGIPIRKLVRAHFDDYEAQRLVEATATIKNMPLAIYDDCYTLDEIDLKIRKHKLQGGLDVVGIDFVQNIITRGESIYDRMSEVAIRLQQMAKRHEVCIFALSQVSEGKEKGSISLRGAQELASAADIVLWIERKPDEREFSLIIRKNRPFGVTGKIPMTFTESWTGVREL